jgi:hypothetical protein
MTSTNNMEYNIVKPSLVRQLGDYKWKAAEKFMNHKASINESILVESSYDLERGDTHHVLIKTIDGMIKKTYTVNHNVNPNTTYNKIDYWRWAEQRQC